MIINGKKPEDCLWIDNQTNIINNNGYDFQRVTKESINTELEEDANVQTLPEDIKTNADLEEQQETLN